MELMIQLQAAISEVDSFIAFDSDGELIPITDEEHIAFIQALKWLAAACGAVLAVS